jgi:malate synthase
MTASSLEKLDAELRGAIKPGYIEILTPEALDFVSNLHRRFNSTRLQLLQERQVRQEKIHSGELPAFLPETKDIREGDWQVAPIPEDLQNRQTEITGPVDRKMVINALNSGAKVFMADFEDATSPTWDNLMQGQINLRDAVRREIDFTADNGKTYKLNKKTAVLKVRPRGWHLPEKHVLVDGEPISASIFDFGLFFFHNAKTLLEKGSGPYFYLPKLESHKEARLWNEIFIEAQKELGIDNGTIKVTVLIETILAALEMDEIIYELRDHMAGLNAGRWDYIFSIIKKFRNYNKCILPDRGLITMQVPFMQAYAQLLVKTCHKRGAHAMGGMSAFIPSKDEEANKLAFEKVKADKELEASNGFDGTWVAHPGLIPVAAEAFRKVIGDKPHQKDVLREDVQFTDMDLLKFKVKNGEISKAGLRLNINVAILYIESWLSGTGAAALYNLMEDAATAEISRAQVWQWVHNKYVYTREGDEITDTLVKKLIQEELYKIEKQVGSSEFTRRPFVKAARIFEDLVLNKEFEEFLTLPAYEYL